MNKRGQSIFLGAVVGILLFMFGMIFYNFITPEYWNDGENSMMNEIGCGYVENGTVFGSEDLSDGGKMTCLIGELVVPYFIIIVVSAAGGIITSRWLV